MAPPQIQMAAHNFILNLCNNNIYRFRKANRMVTDEEYNFSEVIWV